MNTKKEKREEEKKDKRQLYSLAGKDILETLLGILKRKNPNSENEYIQKFYEFHAAEKTAKHARYSEKEKRTFLYVCLILINIFILAFRYVYAYCHLGKRIVANTPLYIAPAAVLPYVAWVQATNEEFWAFHKRKRLFFYFCTINAFLVLMQPFYTLYRNISVSFILKIPLNPLFTEKMALLHAYLLIAGLFFLTCFVIYRQIEPVILSPTTRRQIELFKLQHIKDDRQSREYKYDIRAIKNLETGKPIKIKENDRFVQTEINGAIGTGKTSTIFGGVIKDDLDQKVRNREKRQEELMQMILDRKATIQGPLKEFNENAIVPLGKTDREYKRNQTMLDKIRRKYPDCGMTIVAPNSSMIIDIIRMCGARQINVNVLDPVGDYSAYSNARQVSINPFYLPVGLEESERVIRIAEASTVFADVLIATNQMGGQSDVYFTDISLSVSSNIAAVVMLAKNIQGQQAYIDDVHECISNFENLKPYVEVIERTFGITVEASDTGNKGYGKLTADEVLMAQKGIKSPASDKAAKKNPYYQQILFVKQELLGAGQEAMFSQARGLRNLITKILQDPRIKKKLSAKNDDRIDFDAILAQNQITVVNTAIELGQSISTSFGLFFLLLHRASVLRRPQQTRTPHFLWIDECAQYVHPFFDDVIALYRQYRVAAVLTLQSLTQLEKKNATAYLKNVFHGAGTHIVFGRLAPEEMKLYSEMAGIIREGQEQKSISEKSVLSTNPLCNESVRIMPTITNIMEGADLRTLNFLEFTIFTVDNERVLQGQFARVFFVGQDAFDQQETKTYLWEKAVPEAFEDENEDIRAEPVGCQDAEEDEEQDEEQEPIVFNDTVLEEDMEDILIQATPLQESIEGGGEDQSLNELYLMLTSSKQK